MKLRSVRFCCGDRPQFLEQLPLRERGGQVEGVADADVARNRLRDQLVPRGQAQLMQHSCLLGQAGADVPPDEGRGAAGEVAGGWGTTAGEATAGERTAGERTAGEATAGEATSDLRVAGGEVKELRGEWGSAKWRNGAGKLRPTGLTADYRPAHCPSSRTRDFIREGGMERRSPDRHRGAQGSETPIAIPRMALRTRSAGLQAGIVPRRFAGGRDEPQTAGWLPSRRIPKRHGDAQARERRPLVGTAAR